MACIKLDADEAPADAPCSHKRGPGAAKGIKDKARRLAKSGDQGFERRGRLLGGFWVGCSRLPVKVQSITSEIGRYAGPFAWSFRIVLILEIVNDI
jgi:hypothetical protein